MPGPGELAIIAVIGVIAALLLARIFVGVRGWARQTQRPEARAIRVVGVGGGGSNAVDRMVAARIRGVSFVACNTDAQALRRSGAGTKLRIGDAITRGLGSGGDPDVGRRAAEEDRARIAHAVGGADLVFVTAGLGGGTGSGAAPIIAASAREQGALTIAVVTKPFDFEGSQRRRIADAAATALADSVDALIVVPNDRVGDVLADDTPMLEAFRVVDDVLLQAVQGIIELITSPGMINLDFADIRSVMKDAGPALIGVGRGTGEHRASDAARQAITSPLLEANIDGARGILFNVSGPADLGLREIQLAAHEIRERADADANVIFGTSLDTSLGDDVVITLIATGLTAHPERRPAAPPAPKPRLRRAPAVEVTTPAEPPVREVRARSAVDSMATQAKTNGNGVPRSSDSDVVDLEVPSFLRRRRDASDDD
ncbi:MAG TPA: cell division protein FtsZ [Candidatus Limnocylindrales bacterium]|nr:cell division protein FtsZ [Candidatus Limnocylindrales bacterium]